MKPIEIAKQYETTHFDGDAPLEQSETKDGVGISQRVKGIKGDERLIDPEFIVVLPVSSPRRLIPDFDPASAARILP